MNQRRQSAGQPISLEVTISELVHELANPLTGMSASLQILERHLTQNERQFDGTIVSTLQNLREEIVRLHSLLEEFRCLRGPVLLNLQPIALACIVEDLLALEAWEYAKGGVQVVQDFPPGLPPAMADPQKLKQVLLNLCKNAVEAMPKGGTLTLRGYQSRNHICLEVADTGEGISQGTPIFELFKTTKPSGKGIGLVVARQIVSAHRGKLSYASEKGQGTVFCVSLPLAS